MLKAIIIRNAESASNVKSITVVEGLPMTNDGRDAATLLRKECDEGDRIIMVDDRVDIDYLRYNPDSESLVADKRLTRPHYL